MLTTHRQKAITPACMDILKTLHGDMEKPKQVQAHLEAGTTTKKKQYEAGNHKFSEVGHYLNIVNPDDETTGFALQKVNGVYAQEFGYFEEKDVVMSVDEFETSFNNYYNNLKSVDAQHKALKDAVNNANGTTTKMTLH